MPFLKRLGFFLFGLAIGLIFLAIFLKKKSDETGVTFCYFPNCRTLKDIRSKALSYSAEVGEMVENGTLDTLDVKNVLTEGNIDFGKSDTKSKDCKTYFVEGMIDGRESTLEVKNCQDKAIVVGVQ
ncbi:MAG: DUF4258 domain-containing protein [Aurantibacter sp.]